MKIIDSTDFVDFVDLTDKVEAILDGNTTMTIGIVIHEVLATIIKAHPDPKSFISGVISDMRETYQESA